VPEATQDWEHVSVLAIDRELAEGIPPHRLMPAGRRSLAPVVRVDPGPLALDHPAAPDPGGFGLLLLQGFICRRVEQRGRFSAELLGPGDLLRPGPSNGNGETVPVQLSLTAITPVRLAALGRSFAVRIAPFPEVAANLAGRALLRSGHLAVMAAIVQERRIETRLQLLFWHLADRWGLVTANGVRVGLPLTHSLLSELVAARRPTVSTAIGALERQGVLARRNGDWLLLSGPPAVPEVV
jgi:CRP/FNR family transcriptional regulator, cyclic AMP receptor protein